MENKSILDKPRNTGTVTSVTGTAPIVSSGGAATAISIPAATNTVPGYMTTAEVTALESATAAQHTQGTDQGFDTGGANAVTAAQAKATVSGFNAITYSRFEKSLAESLMPADGLTYFHMGGLFEEDADGNLMPKASPDASIDTFFTLDVSDNIQPSA